VNSDEVPLPSTYKAILCHTATDITNDPKYHAGVNFVGPDYIYGYGRVNAQAAVDAIRDKRFLEGVILAADDEDIYTFDVSPGEDELKVTFAWDDSAGTPGAADILQNDLDLVLINPDGTEFYPPWELDPDNPENPATRSEYVSEALAEDHRDDVNVLEQVAVENPDPGTWTVKVKADDLPYPYQRYSIIAGDGPDDRLEGQVDVVQVLDRSGSMGGLASASSTDEKIKVLRDAADHFIQMMKRDVGNQLGLVQFNQDVVPFPMPEPHLKLFTTASAADMSGAVTTIDRGGLTSIGDGLDKALDYFTTYSEPNNDKVVLLVTDGKENTSMMIEDVRQDLIDNQIAVYPLGLGYSWGINEGKLTDLADATGGTYRITSDDLIFRKFFIEVLAGAVQDWSVITDPISEIKRDSIMSTPVSITADQNGATFTVYWEGVNDAIDLELVTPSETTITPGMQNNRIRYGEHPRYIFYQLDFPLSGDLGGNWEGEWKMKLTGTSQIPAGQKVRFATSAFAEGGAELSIVLDRLFHLTGDSVLIRAQLTKYGSPLTGAKIDVYCNVPIVGAGNLLHDGRVSLDDLKKIHVIHGDTVNLIDRKLQILAERAGKEILLRGDESFRLYDDGQHGDSEPNDGAYANSFRETQIPGSYTLRFVASEIPAGAGLTTTREWTKSFFNEVNIDSKYSDIYTIQLTKTADGQRYSVKIVPKDRFGNYLGPGHSVVVTVSYDGRTRQIPLPLTDNIDGTYTKEIVVTQNELDAGATLEIDVDGKRFTTIEPPSDWKWALSIHSGTAIPISSFADDFDPGINILLDVDYHPTPQLSLVGLFGYNDFKSKITCVDDNYWINLSANIRYYRPWRVLPGSSLSYYIGFGPGVYIPDVGDTEFGANAGFGFNYEFSPSIVFELGADYHIIFDPDIKFVHSHAGVVFRF